MATTNTNWRFFRAGGFDQVRLDTAAELLRIGQLDQKLWVALACPVKGIEFDSRVLKLVDSDGDGFVRAPELIAAVGWAEARLQDAEVLAQKLAGVPLAAIRGDDAAGARITEAAQEVLADAPDNNGLITVQAASAAKLRRAEKDLAAWRTRGEQAMPLGDDTESAHAALTAVRQKIDDWFVRCSLAAFDARAIGALSVSEEALSALSSKSLTTSAEGIAEMPLASVQTGASLSLAEGLNPAWHARMTAFMTQVVVPLLGQQAQLSAVAWQELQEKWLGYEAWLAEKPDPSAHAQGLQELEQLALYVSSLMDLANNFVAFRSFYARQGKATFQVGTLYLDGRACELCVAVNDAAKHATMAGLSNMFLAYVDCVRGDEKRSIAAAFTAGDADQLMVGRNGIFYDRLGQDWNASIVKMVSQPISLRQAFWSPYKRVGRLISEQMQKMAASKANAANVQLAQAAKQTEQNAINAKPQGPSAFDVGKFAGIFAAIGLALGALGTALAATMGGLLNLHWWQIPLVFTGLMLAISGPAMLIAWFKLRSRNLGPLLDANGWAVNARARINMAFGASLTQRAALPDNAERSLVDPYADKPTPWELYAVVAVGLAGLAWFFL